jgi:hypothetical protein
MQRKNVTLRKVKRGEEEADLEVLRLTPGERIEMVWEVTKNAWAMTGEPLAERLPRHVVRVLRRGS